MEFMMMMNWKKELKTMKEGKMAKYQNSYLVELDDDAWSMDRDEFIQKHGHSQKNVDFYDEKEKEKNSEFDFVAMEQAFYRFLRGERNGS
jgi:hypothetical protein